VSIEVTKRVPEGDHKPWTPSPLCGVHIGARVVVAGVDAPREMEVLELRSCGGSRWEAQLTDESWVSCEDLEVVCPNQRIVLPWPTE
jgi:hypothetical protein